MCKCIKSLGWACPETKKNMHDFIYEVAVLSNQQELNKERSICIALRCVCDLKFNREYETFCLKRSSKLYEETPKS